METIDALEQKLHVARRGVPGARYQTGLVIDLTGPAGNIFYLMGMCNRLSIPPDHHAKMVWHCVCGITPKTILIYGNLFIRLYINTEWSRT